LAANFDRMSAGLWFIMAVTMFVFGLRVRVVFGYDLGDGLGDGVCDGMRIAVFCWVVVVVPPIVGGRGYGGDE
jgi:hypothetical protein